MGGSPICLKTRETPMLMHCVVVELVFSACLVNLPIGIRDSRINSMGYEAQTK